MTREEFETLRDRAKASGETLKSRLKAEGKLNCRHNLSFLDYGDKDKAYNS